MRRRILFKGLAAGLLRIISCYGEPVLETRVPGAVREGGGVRRTPPAISGRLCDE